MKKIDIEILEWKIAYNLAKKAGYKHFLEPIRDRLFVLLAKKEKGADK